MFRIWLILWAMLAVTSSAWAEDVTLAESDTLDVPLTPTVIGQANHQRVLVFRDIATFQVTKDWRDQDLQVEQRGNTLSIWLLNPTFTAVVPIFGDNGRIYNLNIFGTDRPGLDPIINVYGAKSAEAQKKSFTDGLPESMDSQIVRLTKHVYGFKPQTDVMVADDYDQEMLAKGERVIGRRIQEIDDFLIKSVRIYRLKDMICYMCVVVHTGREPGPKVFPFQSLHVKGLRGILPRTISVVDREYPGMVLRNNEPRIMYIFCRR